MRMGGYGGLDPLGMTYGNRGQNMRGGYGVYDDHMGNMEKWHEAAY